MSERSKRRRRNDDESDEDTDDDFIDPTQIPFAPAGPTPRRLRRIHQDIYNDDDESVGNSSDGQDTPIVQEIEEEDAVIDMEVDDVPDEDEEEGEDLIENAMKDYQRIDALDTYGSEGIDDREYDSIDRETRLAAEAEIARREQTRDSSGIYAMDDFQMEEDEDARRKRRDQFLPQRLDVEGEDEVEAEQEEADVNLEAFNVPLREWIAQDRTRREVQRRFRRFLATYRGSDGSHVRKGPLMYNMKIRNMAANNGQSLEVSFLHLADVEPTMAIWLQEAPRDMLDILNESTTKYTLELFPHYSTIRDEIHVRFSDFPILDGLRELRRSHLDTLVKITGVVTRRSSVFPQIKLAYYDCAKCNTALGPYRVDNGLGPSGATSEDNTDGSSLNAPGVCANCESHGPFKLNSAKTLYRNYQRVTIQETPGTVPAGRVPRSKVLIFSNDLCDRARPGEEVEVTGIYTFFHNISMSYKTGFQVFDTQIDANHVCRKEDLASSKNLTSGDREKILELARDPMIGDRIARSIAPSIYGHKHVKTAIAMSLFGGVAKNINNKHRIRGDCNLLLLGDPGTAKSQFLKYAEKTAPRAVYSTGKGASAVGLTASVHKDPITKEWTLEGGALVLADRGLCLIDEFDKMNEQDRTSIHEAMEQSISVSKAGIITSLQARCSVIAAANPIGGRYDSSCTLAENVELTDPILQRFDILCVLQDVVDPVADERLADFVVSSHMRATPISELRSERNNKGIKESLMEPPSGDQDSDIIPQDLLRKYIQYARANVRPQLRGDFDQEKVASLYVALRKESAVSGGVPIAVRHIESIMRMSEAHAKMHLREYVREDDIDAAIEVMLTSFISAQKFSVQRALQKSFAKFYSSGNDRSHLLLHILQDLFRKESVYQAVRNKHLRKNVEEGSITLEVPLEDFESRARDRKVYTFIEFLHSKDFLDAGYELDRLKGVIRRR